MEILFQEGLLKVLVATETMSTGLNMPAKTVVFTSPRKFDGNGYRWISSGEYVQMSGRAGRRGLDDRGLVLLMIDERIDPKVARDMLHGRSDPLDSAFRLTYGTITNLTRLEGHDAASLARRSFAQFQSERRVPALEAEAAPSRRARCGPRGGCAPCVRSSPPHLRRVGRRRSRGSLRRGRLWPSAGARCMTPAAVRLWK